MTPTIMTLATGENLPAVLLFGKPWITGDTLCRVSGHASGAEVDKVWRWFNRRFGPESTQLLPGPKPRTRVYSFHGVWELALGSKSDWGHFYWKLVFDMVPEEQWMNAFPFLQPFADLRNLNDAVPAGNA